LRSAYLLCISIVHSKRSLYLNTVLPLTVYFDIINTITYNNHYMLFNSI
jgi:hypothetical protein